MPDCSVDGFGSTPEAEARARWSPLGPVVLVVMLVAFFWQPLLLGRAFYVYDLSMAYLPVQLENARLRAEGEFPLWNRYLYCGYPINAESESGGLYPPALVFNLPLSPERAYGLYVVFHYALAFGAMLLLGRQLGLGAVGRTVAAMVLVFGGTFVSQTVNLPLVSTFGWVPLILYLQLRALERRSFGPAVLAGVCLGVQLLGSHPQMTFYGGLMFLLAAWVRPVCRTERPSLWFSSRVLAVIMLVGVGLGAPQLFYNLQLLVLSDRSGGVSFDFLTRLSYPPHYLGQLLVPDLLGTDSNYIGTENFEEQRAYLGLVTLGALVVGWSMAGRRGLYLRVLLLVSLVLALGRFAGVYHLLYYVPGFNMFRAPVRWWFPLSLAAGVLAGHGIDRMLSRQAGGERRARRGLVGYVVLMVVLLGVGLLLRGGGEEATTGGGEQASSSGLLRVYETVMDWGVQDRRDNIRMVEPDKFAEMLPRAMSDLGRCALWGALLAGMTALWWWGGNRAASARYAALGLLFLLGVDLWLASGRVHRFAPSDYYRVSDARLDIYRSDPGRFRIMPLARSRARDPDPSSLIRNFGSLYELEVLDGFASVDLRLMKKFVAGGMTRAQLNMVGAKYFQMALPLERPGMTEVHRDEDCRVYRNEEALPRVVLVRDYEVIGDEDRRFARLKSPAFDPSEVVLLEREPRFLASDRPEAPTESAVRITNYEGQRVEIRAELAEPAVLVLHDLFFPGWKATINGDETRIEPMRVNGIFRGLALGRGTFEVEFVYRPASFYAGLYVALVTLLGIGVWGVRGAVRRRGG